MISDEGIKPRSGPTYTKIFLMDGLVGGPIDILELGPFRPRAEGSRIRSALVRIPDDGEQTR